MTSTVSISYANGYVDHDWRKLVSNFVSSREPGSH